MIKRSVITIFLVAVAIFAFGMAQAAQIDGLQTNSGPALPAGLTVYVNPGAAGDALLYGYYNARGSFNFIRVVNTSSTTAISAKVRFREGVYSNEVLDFFICLSPDDQWSAWVIDDGNSANPATLISWDDDTPTYPQTTQMDIIPFAYSATGAAPVVTADMTKEGYLEIIAVSGWADGHAANRGVNTSKECGQILGLETGLLDMDNNGTGETDRLSIIDDAPDTLVGAEVIFDVADGIGQYALNATALASCRSTPVANPGLGTDNPPRIDNCDDGIDGVEYVLTKAAEAALYDIEAAFLGNSDIINTFPTKRRSIAIATGNGPWPVNAIIDSQGRVCIDANNDGDCNDSGDSLEVCIDVLLSVFDDEENTISPETGFSPGEPEELEKCDEVNYLVVGQSKTALLNTILEQFKINTGNFEIGWVKEDFATPGYSTTFNQSTTWGLPVISYELGALVNGYWTWMLPLRYTTDFIGPD